MSHAHPWTQPQHRHPWEADDYGNESDSDDEFEVSPVEFATKEFVDMVLDLYLTSKLSARTLCVMAYWLEKAGL